jgi:hypothetical protein
MAQNPLPLGMGSMSNPSELDELRTAYVEMRERKSEQSGSAYGEHYLLVAIMRRFGITDRFEASSEVENYVEHLLIYNERPSIY